MTAEGRPDGLRTSFTLSLGKQLKEIPTIHSPASRGVS